LSQSTKVVVADAVDMADMLFHGQHSQIADNVDRFHNYGANREGVVVTGKTTKC